MGILKPGKECILIKGKNFGKKIKIEKVENNFVYFKDKDKDKKVGLNHIFPL